MIDGGSLAGVSSAIGCDSRAPGPAVCVGVSGLAIGVVGTVAGLEASAVV